MGVVCCWLCTSTLNLLIAVGNFAATQLLIRLRTYSTHYHKACETSSCVLQLLSDRIDSWADWHVHKSRTSSSCGWDMHAIDSSGGHHARNRISAASTWRAPKQWCLGVTSVVCIAIKPCGVAVIAIFSHDLRVYVIWIVHFFIVVCSAASSVIDDDRLIGWHMSYYPFQLLQWQEIVHDAVLLYFCNGYK